ncbi:MAG: hypothetical protein ABIO44_10920 [Saprospiraceae bacterium]
MNTLIVDSGSTKSDWVLLFNNEIKEEFTLAGINPITQSKSSILSILDIAKQKLNTYPIEAIFFYGSGCKDVASLMMSEMLKYCFFNSEINVFSDLLAAARSSCDNNVGIVGILGTGSHSCLSDGHQITHERASLGYLLGDEGSGNYYGKELLKAFFYEELSSNLKSKFIECFPFISDNYLSSLYSSNKVSAELAQFFPFLIQNKNSVEIKKIIQKGINEFYNQRISCYKDYSNWPLHIIGSVGLQLKNEYIEFLSMHGFNNIFFYSKPIDGLIKYHQHYVRN